MRLNPHRGDRHLTLSPTDLSSFFECGDKTLLELAVAEKRQRRPGQSEIERRMLERRGREHEARVLEHYRRQVGDDGAGARIAELSAAPATPETSGELARQTLEAMRAGYDVIYQGTLLCDDDSDRPGWLGRPDFLIRVPLGPGAHSELGDFAYEPLDAKLSRSEKARALIQLCGYAELLEKVQGTLPERLWLALGGDDVSPRALRTRDFLAYYRATRRQLEALLSGDEARAASACPEPVSHCDVCAWWLHCDGRRREADHLSFVAGITRRQRSRLDEQGIRELERLARLDAERPVAGIDPGLLAKLRHQARLQVARRDTGKPRFDLLLDAEPGSGLELLPEPTPGDLFLDLEGDAFVAGGGLEYLFGLVQLGEPEFDFVPRSKPGRPSYLAHWATTRAEEKAAFEAVIARILRGREEFRRMHVYHFGQREALALKTLSCRHGSCEEEVDQLLRDGVLVDLHAVVRQGLRASVEGYTLKELEVFHGFQRRTPLRDAARAMQYFGFWLEARDAAVDPDALRDTLATYNEDDCRSTWRLRDWLEERRGELARQVERTLARPAADFGNEADEEPEHRAEVRRLVERLLEGLPPRPDDGGPEASGPDDGDGDAPVEPADVRARRLLADLVGWHWRELKSGYWAYYEARDTPRDEWLGSHLVLDGLEYEGVVGEVKKSWIHRYRFPEQDHAVRSFPSPEVAGAGGKSVNVERVAPGVIDLRRGKASKAPHPTALRPGKPKPSDDQERQLLTVAHSVAERGIDDDELSAARDLLCRRPPRCGQAPGEALARQDEDAVAALERLCLALNRSVLPVQGPPGAGKTHAAARAIVALVRAGKKVGVTANSHQVIRNLLHGVRRAARQANRPAALWHVADPERYGDDEHIEVDRDGKKARAALESGLVQVVGGTSFAWCGEQLAGQVDVLFVDEAGQMSLANALALAASVESLVLIGDPAQLEQPQKGVHPPGAEVSALEHVLGGAATMPPAQGLFLPTTWRLHPAICEFSSSIFYEGKLRSLPGLERQSIVSSGRLSGSGLRHLPVAHRGNTSHSEEEVEQVARLVAELLGGDESEATAARFVDREGVEHRLTAEGVLVVTPYNAQVGALRARLPEGVAVGTVDKFQGREAPVVIYSMATSRGEDAPRGLEFLYSLNRLNVAISRARALAVLVASPELTRAPCRTPRQLRLVNALCAYLERAEVVPAAAD